MRAEIFINLPPVGVSILFFSRECREETGTIGLQLRPRPQIHGSLLTRGWLSFSSSVWSTNQPISWASSSGSRSGTGSSVIFPNLLCHCAGCPSQPTAAPPGCRGLPTTAGHQPWALPGPVLPFQIPGPHPSAQSSRPKSPSSLGRPHCHPLSLHSSGTHCPECWSFPLPDSAGLMPTGSPLGCVPWSCRTNPKLP